MNRRYDTAEYEAGCDLLRKYFTHPAITTDVIVGFPGETEEEFKITEEYLKKYIFMRCTFLNIRCVKVRRRR